MYGYSIPPHLVCQIDIYRWDWNSAMLYRRTWNNGLLVCGQAIQRRNWSPTLPILSDHAPAHEQVLPKTVSKRTWISILRAFRCEYLLISVCQIAGGGCSRSCRWLNPNTRTQINSSRIFLFNLILFDWMPTSKQQSKLQSKLIYIILTIVFQSTFLCKWTFMSHVV